MIYLIGLLAPLSSDPQPSPDSIMLLLPLPAFYDIARNLPRLVEVPRLPHTVAVCGLHKAPAEGGNRGLRFSLSFVAP